MDSAANVFAINKGRFLTDSKSRSHRKLLTEFFELADEHRFYPIAMWTSRDFNQINDALSTAPSLAHARSIDPVTEEITGSV
jgi:hypothetical protein